MWDGKTGGRYTLLHGDKDNTEQLGDVMFLATDNGAQAVWTYLYPGTDKELSEKIGHLIEVKIKVYGLECRYVCNIQWSTFPHGNIALMQV